jgi:hypothetical protein
MVEATNQSGKVSWFGLVLVIALGVWVSGSIANIWHWGYLHADEAVQWSLAKELSEGTPYSTHQDKFHGPTLATALLISAKVTGTAPMDMREDYLRSVVSIFLGLMAAAALILPGVGKGPRYVTAAFILLTGGCTPFRYYFVQEMLLVCGFVWGVALWMRAEGSAPTSRWWLLSGAAFGFALACKVTAAAYLFLFIVALWLLRRFVPDRRWLRFGFGLVASWALFQSVGFTDLDGLRTWWLQLARSLGVASGHSEDTLYAESLEPWGWAATWLAIFALGRSDFSLARWRVRHEADLPCLVALLVFLFHLALPYKTPWLLLLVFSLPLALALPYLLIRGVGRMSTLALGVIIVGSLATRIPWLLLLVFLLPLVLVLPYLLVVGVGRMSALALGLIVVGGLAAGPLSSHSRTSELGSFNQSVEVMSKAYGPKFYVAVEGGHYWPLPYYLRRHPVGYGDFPQAAKAPLRLIPANDDSRPFVPGYVALGPLFLRSDQSDRYWVLVAKGYESGFATYKSP